MKTRCGIYKITNKLNGRAYIGQSVTIEWRWKDHLKGSSLIARALRKYGADNFSFEVVEECERDRLNEREAFHVKDQGTLHPKGYNLREGGSQNASFSKLTKRKLSRLQTEAARRPGQRERQVAANKKAWSDPELRKQHSEHTKQLWRNPDFRAKVQAANTPELSARKSEASKRLWQNPAHKEKMLKVLASNNARSRR